MSQTSYARLRRKRFFERARHTVDGIGRHVDRGIIRTVVALWEHGIETLSSCEGHAKRACNYPWINFTSQEAAKVTPLLEAFYAARNPPEGSRLGWCKFDGGALFRLQPESESRDIPLAQHQAEIAYFTRFLRTADKYLVEVDVEEVLRLKARLREINEVPLDQIRWRENGVPVDVNVDMLEEFRFTGLSNTDFISSGFYKKGYGAVLEEGPLKIVTLSLGEDDEQTQ